MLGFGFHEVMEGTLLREGTPSPFRFELDVRGPSTIRFFTSWLGSAEGTASIEGFVDRAPARGTLEIAPVRKRMIRYVFDFEGPRGELLRFDGRKRIRFWFFGWLVLRGAVYDTGGGELGTAELRFVPRRHLAAFVASFRLVRSRESLPR